MCKSVVVQDDMTGRNSQSLCKQFYILFTFVKEYRSKN